MAKMADDITVRAVGTGPNRRFEIRIDGEEFPWWTQDGVSTSVDARGIPTVTLTIPTNFLDIEHRLE